MGEFRDLEGRLKSPGSWVLGPWLRSIRLSMVLNWSVREPSTSLWGGLGSINLTGLLGTTMDGRRRTWFPTKLWFLVGDQTVMQTVIFFWSICSMGSHDRFRIQMQNKDNAAGLCWRGSSRFSRFGTSNSCDEANLILLPCEVVSGLGNRCGLSSFFTQAAIFHWGLSHSLTNHYPLQFIIDH